MTAATAAARGREVRLRLLRAATELVSERGWTAVSTRVLAERAGVAPGVVHYHYPSVQALLSEAALTAMHKLTEQAGQALADAQTPADALRIMLGFVDGYDGTDPTSLLFAETYLAATRDEPLRARLGEVITAFRRLLADRLTAQGVPAPEATAWVLAAAIDGMVLHRALGPGPSSGAVTPVLSRLIGKETQTP